MIEIGLKYTSELTVTDAVTAIILHTLKFRKSPINKDKTMIFGYTKHTLNIHQTYTKGTHNEEFCSHGGNSCLGRSKLPLRSEQRIGLLSGSLEGAKCAT